MSYYIDNNDWVMFCTMSSTILWDYFLNDCVLFVSQGSYIGGTYHTNLNSILNPMFVSADEYHIRLRVDTGHDEVFNMYSTILDDITI